MHVPVLGAGDVQQVVGGVEVETEARRAPRDGATYRFALLRHAPEDHQVGVLEPLLHVPLRHLCGEMAG